MKRRHNIERAFKGKFDGSGSESCRQDTIKRCRAAATLEIGEIGHANWHAHAFRQLVGDVLSHAPQSHVSEGIDFRLINNLSAQTVRCSTFCNDDNAESLLQLLSPLNLLEDRVDVEVLFRNEDNVGSTGHAS